MSSNLAELLEKALGSYIFSNTTFTNRVVTLPTFRANDLAFVREEMAIFALKKVEAENARKVTTIFVNLVLQNYSVSCSNQLRIPVPSYRTHTKLVHYIWHSPNVTAGMPV